MQQVSDGGRPSGAIAPVTVGRSLLDEVARDGAWALLAYSSTYVYTPARSTRTVIRWWSAMGSRRVGGDDGSARGRRPPAAGERLARRRGHRLAVSVILSEPASVGQSPRRSLWCGRWYPCMG